MKRFLSTRENCPICHEKYEAIMKDLKKDPICDEKKNVSIEHKQFTTQLFEKTQKN